MASARSRSGIWYLFVVAVASVCSRSGICLLSQCHLLESKGGGSDRNGAPMAARQGGLRAISIVSRLRSLAFQLVMATSLDETLLATGDLTDSSTGRTHYGDVRATNFNIVLTSTSTDIGQLLIFNIG